MTFRFDGFTPGQVIGRHAEPVSPELIDGWAAVYGRAEGVPDGLASVLLMRAYLTVVAPRPPGNIHVQQQVRLLAPLAPGDMVGTEIACLDKELRRERRYVRLSAAGSRQGEPVFDGLLTLIWAA